MPAGSLSLATQRERYPPHIDGGHTYYNDIGARRAQNERLPISTCPAEILVQILSHTLDERPSLASVLLCGAVCYKWRKTTWASSELWSTICFNFEYSEYSAPMRRITPNDMDLLKQWMSRTGTSRPLTISIKCSVFSFRVPTTCPFEEPTKLLLFLCDHRHRWKRLDLCTPWSWFARIQNHTFPILERIHFTAFHTDPAVLRGTSLESCLQLWNVPALRYVELHGIDGHKFILPWAQLRHVSIRETRPKGFLEILPLCTSAVHIDVSLIWGAYQNWHSPRSVAQRKRSELPDLERLSILCEEPGFASSILMGIAAPRLQSLTMNLFEGKMDPLPPAIYSFVKKCKLRRLVLEVDYRNSAVLERDVMAFCDNLTGKTLIPIELRASKRHSLLDT